MYFKSVLLLLFLLALPIYSQDPEPPALLNTPQNIIRFADFLFCHGDYFRASLEYERYISFTPNDTVLFKAALGYSNSMNFDKAKQLLMPLWGNESLGSSVLQEYYKIDLIQERYSSLDQIPTGYTTNPSLLKLYYSSALLRNDAPPEKSEFASVFKDDPEMLRFYDMRINPQEKSLVLAGILSALIPGAGKIYTEEYLDGVFAFISTGVMAFLAFDNFNASHNFRGWLFTGLAALFYTGNVYGSIASANLFNNNFRNNLNNAIKSKLENLNYFIPPYDFCK